MAGDAAVEGFAGSAAVSRAPLAVLCC